MLLVIDYDETYTADPKFWTDFISRAKGNEDTVICCTNRFGNPRADEDVIAAMTFNQVEDMPIVWAAHHKDKVTAIEAAGYVSENAIWIDDSPQFIRIDETHKQLKERIAELESDLLEKQSELSSRA